MKSKCVKLNLVAIFGHFRTYLVIFGHFWSFLVIFGSFWSLLVTFDPLRSILVTIGNFYSFFVPLVPFCQLLLLFVIFGHYWSLLITLGHFWSFLVTLKVILFVCILIEKNFSRGPSLKVIFSLVNECKQMRAWNCLQPGLFFRISIWRISLSNCFLFSKSSFLS